MKDKEQTPGPEAAVSEIETLKKDLELSKQEVLSLQHKMEKSRQESISLQNELELSKHEVLSLQQELGQEMNKNHNRELEVEKQQHPAGTMIPMTKNGEKIEVHSSCVKGHELVGWKIAE